MITRRSLSRCYDFHANLSSMLFAEFPDSLWKGKTLGGDNDMEVSMSISLRPALYATPHLNNLHHKKRTVPTECPRPITVNGDVYIFSSSLFVWNQLWEPSPRLNTLANILLIWLENKPTRYVECSIEMREWHKPQTFTHTNTLSETVTV